MNFIRRQSEFLLDKEFESIIFDITSLCENDNTFEWEFETKTKLQRFLSKLPKEKIKKYFEKFVSRLKTLSGKTKNKILVGVISTFLLFTSVDNLMSSNVDSEIKNLVTASVGTQSEPESEVEIKKAEFSAAQEMVKQGEGGYTDDKNDKGNWVDGNLVGTNHGISAPELKTHLGRVPTKEEMEDLSYEDALDIYEDRFWTKHNLGSFTNQSIANIVYDGIVNQGQHGMKKVLQKTLATFDMDVKMKNIYDVETIENLNGLDQEELFNEISDQRWKRYQDTRKFNVYGDGWRNRLDEFTFQQ
ncbi:MAG: putative lysozyme family protein [uncultured marine phage]|uniref:Putative lysozyme family protein n=1 Tax=uncultured marine phage TaxID=707152 RepID=A0A8D9CDK6_9VIRU|nr:MAG: putative lysozyme family protein [uncultured marine phage]